jgi:protein-S-isoprenylcysteine O-methyltransferase Ste14
MISSWSLIIIAVCLLFFFGVNLHNVLRYHRRSTAETAKPEVEEPHGFTVGLVALGTGAFFLESLVYIVFGALGHRASLWAAFDLAVHSDFLEVVGASVMATGYAIFIWSVLARGQYATSWDMPEKQRLVDWGPYGHVRHPSYPGYVLMFAGFFIISHNLLAIVPFIAIPGYLRVAFQEEEMLLKRFGEEYRKYMRETKQLIPLVY